MRQKSSARVSVMWPRLELVLNLADDAGAHPRLFPGPEGTGLAIAGALTFVGGRKDSCVQGTMPAGRLRARGRRSMQPLRACILALSCVGPRETHCCAGSSRCCPLACPTARPAPTVAVGLVLFRGCTPFPPIGTHRQRGRGCTAPRSK